MPEYSPDELDIVRKAAAEGCTATQIAARLTNRTRNSVISVCHRKKITLNSGKKFGGGWSRRKEINKLRKERGLPELPPRRRTPHVGTPMRPVLKNKLKEYRPLREDRSISSHVQYPYVPNPYYKMKKVQLVELTSQMCKWPEGDPRDHSSFFFCGNPTESSGEPYCKHHMGQASARSNPSNHSHIAKSALFRVK